MPASRAPARLRATLLGMVAGALCTVAGSASGQCLPATPTQGETVSCGGTIAGGYRVPSGIFDVTVLVQPGAVVGPTIGDGIRAEQQSDIDNHGTITVNGISSAGLRVAEGSATDRSTVTNASDGTIVLVADQTTGVALGFPPPPGSSATPPSRGDARNDGAIVVQGANATAIAANPGTSGDPSTAVNGPTGTISLDGDDAIGMSVGGNVTGSNQGSITGSGANVVGVRGRQGATVDQSGTITLSGDGSRGVGAARDALSVNRGTITMSGANASGLAGAVGDLSQAARPTIENAATGLVVVTGTGSDAMSVGRQGEGRNFGALDAQGAGAAGMIADTDSILINGGTITVSGTDAIGVDTDNYDPGSFGQQGPDFYNFRNSADASTGTAGSIVSTNADSGALVDLRNSLATGRNRVRNDAGATIRADLSNVASAGRGIAIQGSAGVDEVVNAGTIEGLIDLGDGDDTYTALPGSVVAAVPGFVPLDGGDGTDEIRLGAESSELGQFAPDLSTGFEALRIEGLWSLTAPVPAALPVFVEPGGALRLSAATHVTSDLSFTAPTGGQAPGVLQAVVDGATSTLPELLRVDGTATLTDGVLEVFVDNHFSGTANVTVLRASTDMVGRFAAVSLPDDPGLSLGDVVYDDAANTTSFTVSALPFTPNQAATSAYLDRLQASGPPADLQAVLDGIDALEFSSYRAALAQLNPEAYDAHTATTLELANRYSQLMLERPRYCVVDRDARRSDPRTRLPCRERRFEPWVALYGQLGHRTGRSDHISYDDEGAGLVAGLDHRVSDTLLLAGSVGGAYDALSVEGVGKGRIKTLDLGLYAGYTRGRTRVQGVATYGYGWHTRFRQLRLPGFSRTAEAAWGSHRLGTRVQGEYAVGLRGFDLVPMASVDYSLMRQDAFAETGARPVSLLVEERTDHVVTLRAGFELTRPLHKSGYWTDLLEHGDGVWRPTVSVRWRQVVSGYDRPLTARFVGDPADAAGTFTVDGDAPEMGFEIGGGLDWTPRRADRLTFGVRYDVFVWEDVTSHDLSARVRLGF